MSETDVSNTNSKGRRSRRRKSTKKREDKNKAECVDSANDTVKTMSDERNPETKKKTERKTKKSKRRRRIERQFGFFCCKVCRQTWASSHVYTIEGTKKVLWKQRCKKCTGPDAWVNPFRVEPMYCSSCGKIDCICTCDECGKLKYKPKHLRKKDPALTPGADDQAGKYCECKKTRNPRSAIDPRKRHLSHLCQKCQSGFPCEEAQNANLAVIYEESDERPDIEP